ncbi:MAPEG family protein [Roseibium polysiphoniae]|uniref:MAPEG family protein n=1 Tax=Roseibium polysiphoniae TaxID=2571221 RepID=UPI003297DCA3
MSLIVLAAVSLIALAQSALCAPLAFVNEEQTPGMPLCLDHSQLSFRAIRTYANTTENLPAFGFALVVAITAGASPTLVNWLAGTYLAFRLLFWAIYYSGIGRISGGPRTLSYIGWLAANFILAGTAVQALM